MIAIVLLIFFLGMSMHLFLIAQQAIVAGEWVIAGFMCMGSAFFFVLFLGVIIAETLSHLESKRQKWP